jgi:hypothetical protein
VKIEDTFTVNAPVERVWALIRDPAIVAPCVPGLERVEVAGPTSYRAAVKVAVGPIKTTFSVTVDVTEETPPHFLKSVTKGDEGGRASTLTAHNELRLSPGADGGTEVHYASDVSIFGRLGKFGLGIMKKKAKETGDQFAAAFRAKAEGG